MLHVLYPVEFLHPQRVNTLVHAYCGRSASTGGNRIPRRILLQLNILVIHLLDVFLDLIVGRRRAPACFSLAYTASNHI